MSRLCIQASWDDVPHLSASTKAALIDAMEPHTRDARTKGLPVLGAGVIYPVPESVIITDPFDIPAFWPKAYGMDVGWKRTAAIFGAWDRQSDTVYLYSEHYMGQSAPSVHADGIKQRGAWIPGAIDPASAGSGQLDGRKLKDEYRALGLNLYEADNAVEAGLHACYQRMVSGRLKVFSTLRNWLSEFRIYRRNEDGKIVKENDHLMDAMRYLIMTGMRYARTEPALDEDDAEYTRTTRNGSTGY